MFRVHLLQKHHLRVQEGNKEAKTLTARKIINVDYYQFSVERSMKQSWSRTGFHTRGNVKGALARKSEDDHAQALLSGKTEMVGHK